MLGALALGGDSSEDLRIRTLEAYESAPVIHFAIATRVVDALGEPHTRVTELYRERPMYGLRQFDPDSGQEQLLLITNGERILHFQRGELMETVEGLSSVRTKMDHYYDACRYLATALERPGPEFVPFRVEFHLGVAQVGELADASLRLDRGARPDWLAGPVACEGQWSVEDGGRFARVKSKVTMRIRLSDGAIVGWEDDAGSIAAEVSPSMTLEEWRMKVDSLAHKAQGQREPEQWCLPVAQGLDEVMRWYLGGAEPRRLDQHWMVAALVASIDAEVHHMSLGCEDAPGAAAASAGQPPSAASGEGAMETFLTKHVVGPVEWMVGSYATSPSWSPKDRDELIGVISHAYRMALHAVVNSPR